MIMKCLAVKVEDRYQSAVRDPPRPLRDPGRETKSTEIEDILGRIRARENRKADHCWNCRRPLPLRAKTCPYCGEAPDPGGRIDFFGSLRIK